MSDLRITGSVRIPEHEIELNFVRSGGPGGQKVNTSATKVELRFDLDATDALDTEQKERVRDHLGNRISKDGILILHSSEYRTQGRNRKAVVARFRNLLREALRPSKKRKPTTPTRGSEERRLEEKRQQARKKELRKDPPIPPEYR